VLTDLYIHLQDYQAFERIPVDARTRFDMQILSFSVIPNHWHIIISPQKEPAARLDYCTVRMLDDWTEYFNQAQSTEEPGALRNRVKEYSLSAAPPG